LTRRGSVEKVAFIPHLTIREHPHPPAPSCGRWLGGGRPSAC
jgi:hypothetical protein